MKFPRGLEFRAWGLPILERRRRAFDDGEDVSLRDLAPSDAIAADTAATVTGLAAPFNSPANIAEFVEFLMPGAFSRSLRERDIRALAHHDHALLLGRMSNRTLRLWEDQRGLGFELALPRTGPGLDVSRLVRLKTLTGMSFGFGVPEGGDKWGREDGKITRRVYEAALYEISAVSFPAYSTTSIELGTAREAREARLAAREDRIGRDRQLRVHELQLVALGWAA